MVIVSRHRGEKTSGRTGNSQWFLLFCSHLPIPWTPSKTLLPRSPFLLVLNLEVEVSTEPVIEGRLVDVARCLELEEKGRGRAWL